MANWTIDRAKLTYAIPHWSNGYVDVAGNGHLTIHPRGEKGPTLDLPAIVEEATRQGLRLPLLVRFPDILADRLARLQQAFAKAIDDADYAGGYTAIYPIKVNQQRGVVGELVAAGEHGFGLEAGSKPELMAVLAHARPGSMVVCNGYKDREYVRLALIGRKLGLRVHIVVEKLSELDHVLSEAKALDVEPLLEIPDIVRERGSRLHIHLGRGRVSSASTARRCRGASDGRRVSRRCATRASAQERRSASTNSACSDPTATSRTAST
jgi:arginine decarboxylase